MPWLSSARRRWTATRPKPPLARCSRITKTSRSPGPRWSESSARMADRTGAAPLHRLVGFGRYLRATGLPVGTGRILSFCRSAALLGPFDPADLRLAARATLVSRHEDLTALDGAFDR